MDGDIKNSTYSEKLKQYDASRYIESFIVKQSIVGNAIRAACRYRTVPFVSTFATFFTKAFDQIRMGATSQNNVNFIRSHCEVYEKMVSQIGLEDLELFRSIPDSIVFYPADAVSTVGANIKEITFTRLNRPNTPVIYTNGHVFVVGKANVVKKSDTDQLVLIEGGITLHKAITAFSKQVLMQA